MFCCGPAHSVLAIGSAKIAFVCYFLFLVFFDIAALRLWHTNISRSRLRSRVGKAQLACHDVLSLAIWPSFNTTFFGDSLNTLTLYPLHRARFTSSSLQHQDKYSSDLALPHMYLPTTRSTDKWLRYLRPIYSNLPEIESFKSQKIKKWRWRLFAACTRHSTCTHTHPYTCTPSSLIFWCMESHSSPTCPPLSSRSKQSLSTPLLNFQSSFFITKVVGARSSIFSWPLN